MKIKGLTFLIAFFFLSATGFAQVQTATFKDGTSIDYEIIKNNPDSMNRFNVSYFFIKGLNVSYFMPNRFYATVNYGLWRYGAEGIVFFKSFEIEQPRRHIIKTQYTGYYSQTTYVIKPVIKLKSYLGIHAGYNVMDYSKQMVSMYPEYLSNREIFLGLAFTRVRCAQTKITFGRNASKRNGTAQLNLCVDAIYFADRNFVGTTDPGSTKIDDASTNMGFRIYADGKACFNSDTEFGLIWKIGLQSGPYNEVGELMDLGFYIGF